MSFFSEENFKKYGGMMAVILGISLMALIVIAILPASDTPKVTEAAVEIIEDVVTAETHVPVAAIVSPTATSTNP